MAAKRCGTCDMDLPYEAFNKRKAKSDGYDSQCRECVNTARREFRARNGDRERARTRAWHSANRAHIHAQARAYRERNGDRIREQDRARRADPEVRRVRSERRRDVMYGLEPGQFDAMVLAQNAACGICRTVEEKLVVDHCHETGAVRGLLCRTCNSGIGMLGDDAERIVNAAAYVEAGGVTWPKATAGPENQPTQRQQVALVA